MMRRINEFNSEEIGEVLRRKVGSRVKKIDV
jgi:hypothetical protein